jgi:hypothetical protein
MRTNRDQAQSELPTVKLVVVAPRQRQKSLVPEEPSVTGERLAPRVLRGGSHTRERTSRAARVQ